MAFSPNNQLFKLPSNHCKFLPCFPHEQPPKLLSSHRKSLHSLIVRALCCRIPSPLGSDEEYPDTPDRNLDNSHVIILEIRSRASKAKPRPSDHPFGESLCWVFSPTSGKLIIASRGGGDEGDEFDDDGTEAFYSVKSCFSRCASENGSELVEFPVRSVWDEFRHCEGWPFGLCRRALMLPPLPNSPSDSWTWRKRNHVGKL